MLPRSMTGTERILSLRIEYGGRRLAEWFHQQYKFCIGVFGFDNQRQGGLSEKGQTGKLRRKHATSSDIPIRIFYPKASHWTRIIRSIQIWRSEGKQNARGTASPLLLPLTHSFSIRLQHVAVRYSTICFLLLCLVSSYTELATLALLFFLGLFVITPDVLYDLGKSNIISNSNDEKQP